ncbi:hypothetical protein GCM10007421_28030 [Halopseudomonas oceani]|nr:hypothetical protein GCM10007421_28030 [Halopseudomonas oceani]
MRVIGKIYSPSFAAPKPASGHLLHLPRRRGLTPTALDERPICARLTATIDIARSQKWDLR